jgi:hypothetical protein
LPRVDGSGDDSILPVRTPWAWCRTYVDPEISMSGRRLNSSVFGSGPLIWLWQGRWETL